MLSKRFCNAPHVARFVFTALNRLSIEPIASDAPATVEMVLFDNPAPIDVATFIVDTLILLFAPVSQPTCKLIVVVVPSINETSLNLVVLPTRTISEAN